MGKIVSVIGNKGGTGKTTLSHMMAHGLGLFGKHAVAILTDTLRDRLSKITTATTCHSTPVRRTISRKR